MTIRHEKIPGFMDAMTDAVHPPKDPKAQLDGVKSSDDRVKATLRVETSGREVEDYELSW